MTEEQKNRQEKRDSRRMAGLDINCKVLTSCEMIQTIQAKVGEQLKFKHLCQIPPTFENYVELVKHYSCKMENKSKLLSRPPPINNAGFIPIIKNCA